MYNFDGIEKLFDFEISNYLVSNEYHSGKALEGLSETLKWRKENCVNMILQEDFTDYDMTGKLCWFGTAIDGSSILIWSCSRHNLMKHNSKERELRYIIYFLEKGRIFQ